MGITSTAVAWLGCSGKDPRAGKDPRGSASAASLPQAPILRTIESIASVDGDGATLQRVFPNPALRHLDPFVLLDDFDVRVPAGFPEHPHRGFEAFTYMIEGAFHHRDDLGNDSTIRAGGTQRFNSGRGARHSEMPATNASNRGLQLWVNLPRRLKQMDPQYQGIDGDRMPVDEHRDERVRTIVGDRSAVALQTDIDYLDVELFGTSPWHRDVQADRSTLLYVIEGAAAVGTAIVPRGHAVVLGAGALEVRGDRGTRFAFLSGRPHGEPIHQRGPFVD